MTWNGLQTHMWHHLHTLLSHTSQYLWFWKIFFAPSFYYLSTHILAVHNGCYLSKWQVNWSLHKAVAQETRTNWVCLTQWVVRGFRSSCSRSTFHYDMLWQTPPPWGWCKQKAGVNRVLGKCMGRYWISMLETDSWGEGWEGGLPPSICPNPDNSQLEDITVNSLQTPFT